MFCVSAASRLKEDNVVAAESSGDAAGTNIFTQPDQ